jgi:hypothetical protein
MAKLDEPVIYISDKFPKFKIRVGKKKYQFQKHELHVYTEEEVQALDEILEENSMLKTKFRKVDKAAAEEFVKSLMRKNPRHAAVKGPVSAQDIMHSQSPLQERDAALSQMTEEQVNSLTNEMASDNAFVMTEKANNPVPDSADSAVKTKLNLGQ